MAMSEPILFDARAPDRAEDWAEYLRFEAAVKETMVYRRMRDARGALTHVSRTRRYFGQWRKDIAARLQIDRLMKCSIWLESHEGGEGWAEKMAAYAEALIECPKRLMPTASGVCHSHGLLEPMCRAKASDAEWCIAAFRVVGAIRNLLFSSAVVARDTGRVEKYLRLLASTGLNDKVLTYNQAASVIFHLLDCDRLVSALSECDLSISVHDALSNHRHRERDRRADPTVAPLPMSFYDMVLSSLDRREPTVFEHHQEVMCALDALVEFHRDGRLSKQRLDRARDKLFSMADNNGAHPAYRYLLEESRTLAHNRLASVVVPMAMAMAGRPVGQL